MTWLKFEALQTSASDDFKYISQKQNIISKIQVMIITYCLEIGFLTLSVHVHTLFQAIVCHLTYQNCTYNHMDRLPSFSRDVMCISKASFGRLLTRLSKLLDTNWKL